MNKDVSAAVSRGLAIEKQALALEQQLNKDIALLKASIMEAVEAAGPMPGVTIPTGRRSLQVAIVQFKSLQRNNLAAETYLPSAQLAAVRAVLERRNSISAVMASVEQMRQTGRIKSGDGNWITLNSNTLSVLEQFAHDSELQKTAN